MPARKPTQLTTRHDTAADRATRESAEASVTPKTALTDAIPPALRGRKRAQRTWKRLIGLYSELDAQIATSLDRDMLIEYCLLEEEEAELVLIRKKQLAEWETQKGHAKKIKPTDDNLKEYVKMWEIVNALFQKFQGIDARLDGKRKHLLSLRQSLYMTPRSRAGVAPPEKPEPEPESEMDRILNNPPAPKKN